jgi:hypothetical protein
VASEDRWLENEIVQMHLLISDAVYQDTRKRYSYEEYERAIRHLVSFAQRRPTIVMDEIARAR